jgi:hypothetical protein
MAAIFSFPSSGTLPSMRAVFDPELEVLVRERRALHYRDRADPSTDRPAHVRAASGIARHGGRLAIVQDDTSFLAFLDGDEVHALPLPHSVSGARQFDDARGNKAHKLDLEACVALGDALIGLGSGSTRVRERILVLRDGAPRLVDASSLYAMLRVRTDFSGSELNLEGAALVDGRLRLFQRGNGAPSGGLEPIDATGDLEVEAFLAYLEGGPVPELRDVLRWDLGSIGDVRLGFTDATAHDGRVYFLAAAEASPDAVRDGPCAGVALGVVEPRGARMARLRLEHGGDFALKAEGLAFDGPRGGLLVVDRDDPSSPAELYRFDLVGPWTR